MKALRSLTAAAALAALSVVPATAQAHASNQNRDVQPVSRPADQTSARRTLTRVLAREQHAYPAPSGPETQAAQLALARTLSREGHAYWGSTAGQQPAKPYRAAPSGTFPLLPLLTAVGLAMLLAAAATWRWLRARVRPREAT